MAIGLMLPLQAPSGLGCLAVGMEAKNILLYYLPIAVVEDSQSREIE